MLTLLTTTGARPLPWALCCLWMAQQDYDGPVRWIIVDDGPEPAEINFKRDNWWLDVVRPQPFWEPGKNTQARNLLAGLDRVSFRDKLVIIEDDDYYAPDWLRCVSRWLPGHDMVGLAHARYYNVAQRTFLINPNTAHSSLCSSAFQSDGIDILRAACASRAMFIDLAAWRAGRVRALHTGGQVVGIKGLPGRAGIGVGHKDRFPGAPDPQGLQLRAWVGDAAAAHYLPHHKGA